MAYYFRRSVPSCLITHQVMFLQSQKFALRNSNPVLFQRFYTNSTSHSLPPNTPSKKSTSSSNLNTLNIWILAVTGLVLIPVDLLYAWYRNGRNERLLIKTVENGTQPEIYVSEDELVSRPLVVDRLKKIFQPNKRQSFYHIVCGDIGTGKTTLTRIASNEVGHGVIYIDIPPNVKDFGKVFGKALNFEKHISYTVQLKNKIFGNTNYKFEIAMEAFKRASAVYKKKHGKPTVIVYDHVYRLIDTNPKILDTLQDDAKANADGKKYIAVFVCNEVPERMKSRRNAWTRAYEPVMEISDLSEKESKDYLIKRCTIEKREGSKVTKECKIKDEQVNELYKLVGGRIVELNAVVSKFLAGESLEVIKQQIFFGIEMRFLFANLLPGYPHYKVGKSIINDLLMTKELSFSEFKKHFNMDEELNEVLKSNIFTYHPENHTVSFQSRSVECYIRENADIFVK